MSYNTPNAEAASGSPAAQSASPLCGFSSHTLLRVGRCQLTSRQGDKIRTDAEVRIEGVRAHAVEPEFTRLLWDHPTPPG